MSKLSALKKQIATLEAQAERIAKEEMASAIAKVKGIMAEFNLTIEHLTQTGTGKRAAKKAKVKAASVAKYADPKTGKTWSGFGRAPSWIAGAKNRDAFLVGKGAAPEAVAKEPSSSAKKVAKAAKSVKAAKKTSSAKKTSKPAPTKAAAPAKRAPTKVAKPARKSSAPKAASVAAKKTTAAKKSAAKKAAPKARASEQVVAAPVDSAPTSAP